MGETSGAVNQGPHSPSARDRMMLSNTSLRGSRGSLALTRPVSPSIARCELTHITRRPIDLELAARQLRAYEEALEAVGCEVRRLPAAPDLPDAVFVEDTAVVLDELAVLARPGAPSRRPEVSAVAEALSAWRPLQAIEPPATLDGGDVLVTGRNVYVGASSRTNREGYEQLGDLLTPHGYTVRRVEVRGCLHLKTAVTGVADGLLLVNPDWLDRDVFRGPTGPTAPEVLEVDPEEPFGANALRIGDVVLCASACPRTAARLAAAGLQVRTVDLSELAKAEGGLTCCSLIVRRNG